MVSTGVTMILVAVILIALIFALSNGLHDASSVVATCIACGAATPKQAIAIASVFGMVGSILGGNAVADTISKVIDLPTNISMLSVLFAAILGAVIWNLVTWRLGLPSSSTHALIGGIIGAVWVSSGHRHILWGWNELIGSHHQLVGIMKIVAGLIISPILGFIIAFILQKISTLVFRNAKYTLNNTLNKLQLGIAAALAYSHGANDTQKIIGIITLAIAAAGGLPVNTAPLWVRVSGGFVMFIGTTLGGWTIMRTIGREIFKIRSIHSLNSQLASSGSLILATYTGAPVSTTHVVVGTVIGVGAADEYKMVHWGVAKEIVLAWFITIPMSALVSGIIYSLFHFVIKIV